MLANRANFCWQEMNSSKDVAWEGSRVGITNSNHRGLYVLPALLPYIYLYVLTRYIAIIHLQLIIHTWYVFYTNKAS